MTKEVKHTPGPWALRQFHPEPRITHVLISSAEYPKYWAEVAIVSDKNSELETHQANARLISAAPDLLEAAQEALDELILCWGASIIDTDTKRAIDGLRKAIAKARGE